MTNVQNYLYRGNPIAFDFGGSQKMINATQMAKAFNKRPINFLELPSTQRFIQALIRSERAKVRRLDFGKTDNANEKAKVRFSDFGENDVKRTVRGGNNPELRGTWLHHKLALKFAYWLNADFELWIVDKIEELLTKGSVQLQPISEEQQILNVMNILTNRIATQQQQLIAQQPKVQYYEEVLQSSSTYTVTQIAKDLDMTANQLNRFLHLQGVQFKQNKQWVLYKQHQKKGYTDTLTVKYNDKNGNPKTALQTRWTEKGRKFICDLVGVEV